MALQANPCEGTDGTAVTTANSDDNGGTAFALVSTNGETCAYETTGAIHGTSSIRFSTATATNPVQVGWTDTGATSAVARWYEKWTTLPSATQQNGINFRGNSGATSLMRREVASDGTFRVVMGATTSSFSGSAMSTGTVYRFEAVSTGFNGSSGATTITCYVGESSSAFTSVSVSSATTSFTCDTARFGKFNGAGNMDLLVDSMAANIGSSTPIGGAVQTGSVTDTVTAGATVTGAVGAVGSVTQTVTAAATVTAVTGKVGAVADAITATGTVSGAVGVIGATTSTVTASSTVTATVGPVGTVSETVTADATVTAAVGRVGAVASTLTAVAEVVAEVAAVEPTTRGQGSARDRVVATGNARARTTAQGLARDRAVATGSGR